MQEPTLFELYVRHRPQLFTALDELGISAEVLLKQQKFMERRLLKTEKGAALDTAQLFATSFVLAKERLLPLAFDEEMMLQQIENRRKWAEEQISKIQVESAIRSLSPERR